MRIIAGRLGGRTFDSPKGTKTHPMSDKIRGALFNILGDITGLTVLDAFAGSGALSFEAISRGAARATTIDNDKAAALTIQQNIELLDLASRIDFIRQNVGTWSQAHPEKTYDIVLVDPPYNAIRTQLLMQVVGHVRPGGLVVLSWPGREMPLQFKGLSQLAIKSYGDAQLCIYRG